MNLHSKLDIRSEDLDIMDKRSAIAIRELTKSPDLLLIDRPENYIEHSRFDTFQKILKEAIKKKIAVIFFSNNQDFIKQFSNRSIVIANGKLTS